MANGNHRGKTKWFKRSKQPPATLPVVFNVAQFVRGLRELHRFGPPDTQFAGMCVECGQQQPCRTNQYISETLQRVLTKHDPVIADDISVPPIDQQRCTTVAHDGITRCGGWLNHEGAHYAVRSPVE